VGRSSAARQRVISLNRADGSLIQGGLCAECLHARRVESERGSVFVMCQLSATDARFPKYPRLPVLSCAGYARKELGSEQR
jgi:hypothetical protein